MTRPGKIPSQAGFEPRIIRSRGVHLNHLASEVMVEHRHDRPDTLCNTDKLEYWRYGTHT